MSTSNTSAICQAVSLAGGTTALARAISACGGKPVKHSTIYKWMRSRVPAEHCLAIEQATGVSRHELRPDIFGPVPASQEAA